MTDQTEPPTRRSQNPPDDRARGLGDDPHGRHAVRPLEWSVSDFDFFAVPTEEIFRPPTGIAPWEPGEHDEVPWELRDDS